MAAEHAPTAATSDIHSLESESNWEWSSLTEPSASRVPPIFTQDGSYFFSLVASSVKVHSVATGQVVSTLSAPKPTNSATSSDQLTAAILNPHNAFQLITGSLDGRLVIWDFLEATPLQVVDIGQPIHHICAHKLWKDTVFVAASRLGKKNKTSGIDDNAAVLRVSLKPLNETTKSAEIFPVGKTRFPTGLTLSPSGAWLIATAGHKVYVAASSSLAAGFIKYVSPERLTCLAFHPTDEYFATGDEKGNVRLWYCLNDGLPVGVRGVEKKTQTTTLHWHAHAVSSLAFTPNGAYLLSGGEESVLVIWQLHTGKKEFVPRVGAPINTVSVVKSEGEEEYLLGLADASYLFISSGSLKVSRSYSQIKLEPAVPHGSSSRHKATPLATHSLSSTLILPSSHPSSLQIYSPSSSRLISELEVSPSNRVSRRDEKIIVPSCVEHAVISPSGEWLATIDVRKADDGFRDEIYLKIWLWDQKGGRWTLNTRIDRPHALHNVTCLAFSPLSKNCLSYLVTTGDDGNVKTWGLRNVKSQGMTEQFWVTRSTFGFRSEQPRSATWSRDGSLLAVVFGPHVALYHPVTNVLCQTLASSESELIKSAHFIGKEARYLALVGDHNVTLWDLLSHSVRWSYNTLMTINQLVPQPETDKFAIFHDSSNQELPKTRVSIFRPLSSTPVANHTIPFRLRNMCLYPFSRKPSNYVFVGITDDWGAVLFGDDAKSAKEEGSKATKFVTSSASAKRSLFRDIFGKSAFADQPMVPTGVSGAFSQANGKAAMDVFEAPVYLMPALEHLFEPLMGTFLRPRLDDAPIHVAREEDDIEMEGDTADSVETRTESSRVVNQEEIDTLVKIFKKHSVKCRTTVPTNGHSTHALKPSSSMTIRHIVTNATSPNAHAPKLGVVLPRNVLGDKPQTKPTSPTTLTNGRKRKKSIA